MSESPGEHAPDPWSSDETWPGPIIIGWACWALVGVGVLLRLLHLLLNRSLWFDEAVLANNIISASPSEILRPLVSPPQFAPVGYAVLTKLASAALGYSEYGFRLVPFVAGCLSLPLFYRVARAVLRPRATLLGVGLFAVSHPLIYYAAEAKPYSVDLLACLALLWAATRYDRDGLTPRLVGVWGVAGAAAAWVSFPAVFVLGGWGIVISADALRRRDRVSIFRTAVLLLLWAGGVALVALAFVRHAVVEPWLVDFWADDFLPLSLSSLETPRWGLAKGEELIRISGLVSSGLAALALIIGVVSLSARRRRILLLLLAPLAVALAASAAERYPFADRLLLFSAPITLLVASEGVAAALRWRAGGVLLLLAILLPPAQRAGEHVLYRSHLREELREVLEYAAARSQPGDTWYVYHGAEYAFRYYAPRTGISADDAIFGVRIEDSLADLREDLERLPETGRVWLVLSHPQSFEGEEEWAFLVPLLDESGTRLDARTATDAAVYLFEMGPP